MMSKMLLSVVFVEICREGLGEGYDGDIAFASALEAFGGGHNDPICVAFGGNIHVFCFCLSSEFVIAFYVAG